MLISHITMNHSIRHAKRMPIGGWGTRLPASFYCELLPAGETSLTGSRETGNRLCPCCQETRIAGEQGRLPHAEERGWSATPCNANLNSPEFKART